MTQYLLLHGADPTIVSGHGATPLHLALCPRRYNGDYEDAWKNSRYRLESVLHVNDFEDRNDYSEAHMKIHKQRCAVLHEILMHPKANTNAQDIDGASCLHIVDYRSTVPLVPSDVVKLLLEKGKSDPSLKDREDVTPCLLACREADVICLEALLEVLTTVLV